MGTDQDIQVLRFFQLLGLIYRNLGCAYIYLFLEL
jgi:hypothetical protein